MAVGLSIGDMLAIMQTCYDVGTIILGRSEAPKQFQRVQRVVYSFNEFLNILRAQIQKPDSVFSRADTADQLKVLMSNCEETLKQVQEIVSKYEKTLDEKDAKGFRASLQDNWKMIRWREEEAELATLTQQLIVHQNSIAILANNAKQDDISDTLHKIHQSGQFQHKSKKRKSMLKWPPSDLPAEQPQPVPQRKISAKRPNHPDGLPFVSVERCERIDNWAFEVQISEEGENGRVVICPGARLKGSHFLAPRGAGKLRDDLFQCNCRQWFGGRTSTGYHKEILNNYSCGPKTFIAQSIADTDGPSGETGWWLLQTAVKQGSSKNIFLELKDIEKRPKFAKLVASMLRTNVAVNVILGITQPSDLVKWAVNGPNPHERLRIASSYDERSIGRRGLKLRLEGLSLTQEIEFSDTTDDPDIEAHFPGGRKVQDYFEKPHLPGFSWYRMAMFESVNKSSFIENQDVEDAQFFLDHFHTPSELKVKLCDPWNPNTVYWGIGEFGGIDTAYSSYPEDGKPAEELVFSISRFTVHKEDKGWRSPRPVNCSLHFTFRHGYSSSIPTLFTMWKRYETLSCLKGPVAEFPQAGLETPTKEASRFLMQTKNAVFTDFSVAGSLDPYGFNPTTAFRNCWLLGKKGHNRNSPFNFIIRSIEQDVHCHIYLSINDVRNLRRSVKPSNKSLSFGLFENSPKTSDEEKKSWGWIYPRDPYCTMTPAGIKICGTLKLVFSSESNLSLFLNNIQKLSGMVEENEIIAPPPPYKEKPVSEDTRIPQIEINAPKPLDQICPRQPSPDEVQSPPAKDSLAVWERVNTPDGEAHYVESHIPTRAPEGPQRSKTLPSHSEPPSVLKDRTSSWSVGPPPGPERAVTEPQLHPPHVASGNVWDTRPHSFAHPPPPPQLYLHLPQHQAPPSTEYGHHPGLATQNWYQQPRPSSAYFASDTNHIPSYTATLENRMSVMNIGDNGHTGWNNTSYDYSQVPRWTEPPIENQNISPPRSPFSTFPSDFRQAPHNPSMPNSPLTPQNPIAYPPPQNQNFNGTGSKRCVVVSGYEGSPVHGEVSLQVGQVYDVIPQHNSPWVWIKSQSPYGPSGFAPARNFSDFF